jgi:phosphohistidine phosphatase
MKTLYLTRHAKSDRDNEILADIDRPLNARGYSDAHTMSLMMKQKGLTPDLIITSPAIRAISTALIFSMNFNINPSEIIINRNLYETSVKHYNDIITKTDNQYKHIMIFAHNPTISSFANSLTNSFTGDMPTCGIIGVKFNCKDWEHFTDTTGELVFYDFPRNQVR